MGKNFYLGGPFWLLRLWLNAIFEPLLKYSPPTILYKDIEGTRLCYFSHEKPKDITPIQEFRKFFSASIKLVSTRWNTWTLHLLLAPNGSPSHVSLLSLIRSHKISVLPIGFPGSNNLELTFHAPQFMVRQFDFSQGILPPINLNLESQICNVVVKSFDKLQACLEKNDLRRKGFVSIDVKSSILVSKSFLDWWFEYYQTQHSSLAKCKTRLVTKDPIISSKHICHARVMDHI